MAAQILSSPSKARWDHDVFLSFRGDTRKNFTDRLYEALVLVRVRTFRDNEELPRGKIISDELRKAICGSRIYIVVFSQGHASSTWCLDELAEIVDCRGANEHHTLLPIFYHVDPSDVRKQTGIFAEAFFEHEKRFHTDMGKVERWRKALAKAGSLSGWDVSSIADGYEGKVIEKIVDQVLRELNQAHLHVSEHLVEMDSRVAKVKALLAFEKSDVHIVGIYGMGGIGKTTIAIAIYNHIYLDFEGSSCLLDIKEISKEGLLDVEGLSLNSPKLEGINLKTGAFTNMKNLRLLQINVTHLIENFQLLSNQLRWLCWHNCSLKILPQDLYLGKLVVLDLQESKLIQVWKGYKVLSELKVLNLRNSKNLTKSLNFSGVQHLETLILKGCTKLVEVHESIGCLKGLVKLNLRGCISLTNLPSSIGNLESLKTLDISYCSRLFECSKQVGSMMALTKLHGNETTIEHKLSFLGLSKNHKIELPGYQ